VLDVAFVDDGKRAVESRVVDEEREMVRSIALCLHDVDGDAVAEWQAGEVSDLPAFGKVEDASEGRPRTRRGRAREE
jgi:hypothetical protein